MEEVGPLAVFQWECTKSKKGPFHFVCLWVTQLSPSLSFSVHCTCFQMTSQALSSSQLAYTSNWRRFPMNFSLILSLTTISWPPICRFDWKWMKFDCSVGEAIVCSVGLLQQLGWVLVSWPRPGQTWTAVSWQSHKKIQVGLHYRARWGCTHCGGNWIVTD